MTSNLIQNTGLTYPLAIGLSTGKIKDGHYHPCILQVEISTAVHALSGFDSQKSFNEKTVSQYLPSLLGLWAACVNVFVCLGKCVIKSFCWKKMAVKKCGAVLWWLL